MFDSDRHNRARGRPVARSRYIQFGKECLGTGFMDLPEMRKVGQFLKLAQRGLYFQGGRDSNLLDKFASAHAAKGAEKIASLLILLEALASSRIVHPLASKGYLSQQSHRDSARLERAFAYINRHLNGKLSLAETAKAASFSPQAFSRFFHHHIGITYQAYVIDLRLTEACRLLIETDQTVAEICFHIGFNNLSNFNRHFLTKKKMAPRRYRQIINLNRC
jgi:AraC-like DNA-binding protein